MNAKNHKALLGFFAACVLLGLGGCSDEPAKSEPTAQELILGDAKHPFAADIDPAIKATVLGAWNKVRATCPGLDKYNEDMKWIGIENNYHYSVVFELPEQTPENLGNIPVDYMTSGHKCFFDISHAGDKLYIEKYPCKSICIDKVIANDDPLNDGQAVADLKTLSGLQHLEQTTKIPR